MTTEKKAPARDRLLETAAMLFTQRGFSAVGIDEIIDRAGTAKASFYRYFPSKEHLVEAWLAEIHEGVEKRQRDLLEGDLSPTEKLEACFDSLGTYLEEHDFRGCPYSNSCAVANVEERRIRRQIELHKEARRVFFRKVAFEMSGKEPDADRLGDQLFVLFAGAATESQNLRSLWPVEVAKTAALELCSNPLVAAS